MSEDFGPKQTSREEVVKRLEAIADEFPETSYLIDLLVEKLKVHE